MEKRAKQISTLLGEAAQTHHRVYQMVDGDDPDWATWYADWLINLSELPGLLGKQPVRSQLVYILVKLDKDFSATKAGGTWEDYYATKLVEYFKS